MSSVIEIKNLSKLYRLGVIGSTSLRESVERLWCRLQNKDFSSQRIGQRLLIEENDPQLGPEPNTIWALKDINLKVNEGEILGIVGQNGAGKSTLLKLLTRITEPTEGKAIIRGRVSSLLEVGTGFHPELTGRENIFLNGTLLGMRKVEISRKFDEIVNFAGVERFIDTPVKRYSSGMYVRLAFAVAAHLEPEILIVDEVLAVGDAEFQKKCLGKMKDVASGGRTVLFVSHNMSAIKKLCERVILLKKGRLVQDGPTDDILKKYLGEEETHLQGERVWPQVNHAPGDDVVRVHALRVLNQEGRVSTQFDVRELVTVEIEYWVLKEGMRLVTMFYFVNELGHVIFVSKDNLDSPWKDTTMPKGFYRSRVQVPGDFLNESKISIIYGIGSIGSAMFIGHATDQNVVIFKINDRGDSEGVRGNYPFEWRYDGVRPRLSWKVEKLN